MVCHFRLRTCLCLLLWLWFVTPSVARANMGEIARFDTLWVSDGLPGNAVTSLVQDAQGFVWLGTFSGLARYDGYKLESYYSDPDLPGSLSDVDIRTMLVDGQGTLWIGTLEGGLHRFDPHLRRFINYRHDPQQGTSLSSDSIRALALAQDSQLWIGTGQGLDLFDTATGQVRRFSHNPDQPNQGLPPGTIRALYKSSDGRLWMGSQRGLAWMDTKTHQVTRLPLPGVQTPALRDFVEDDEGSLWIATLQGLFKLEPEAGQATRFEHGLNSPARMLSLAKAPDGSIWAGSTFNGLYRIKDEQVVGRYRYDKTNEATLPDDIVMSLMVDRGGVLWAGTFNGGAARVALESLNMGLYNDSMDSVGCLPSSAIYSLHEHGHWLWIGSQAGLTRFDRSTAECSTWLADNQGEASLPDPEVRAIHRDRKGRLWVGTFQGLVQFDVGRNRFSPAPGGLEGQSIALIGESLGGRLLVGSARGLYRLNPSEGRFEQVSSGACECDDSRMQAWHRDRKGRMWLATHDGLAWLDENEWQIRYVLRTHQLKWHDPIRALYADDMGQIWLGSSRAQLLRFDSHTEQLETVALPTDFPATSEFHAMLPGNDGRLWVSSANGLLRMDAHSGKIRVFRATDGLASDVFFIRSAMASEDGSLYFGGRKGFNRFDPKALTDVPTPPSVVITGLHHFNQPVHPGDDQSAYPLAQSIEMTEALTFSWQDYVFGFEFAALDFAAPGRNQYAWRMKGFEDEFTYADAGQRKVTYTNLAPGDYTFELKAANKNGHWNDNGQAIAIKVKPAPWATGWAYTLYALILLFSVIGVITYRTSSLKRRAIDLQQAVDERTQALAEEKQRVETLLSKKNDEFANVSHEFRTPLTLILGPVNQLLSSDLASNASNKLLTVKRNGYRLLRMVDQLLQMEKFRVEKVGNRSTLALAPTMSLIAQSFEDLAVAKGVGFDIGRIDEVYLDFTRDAAEKILLNLISNAVKYTLPGGKIRVEALANTDNTVQLVVADTGIGIPKEQHPMVFERFHRVMDKHSEQITGFRHWSGTGQRVGGGPSRNY